jgi:formylglycine-generating enzyme required for sulfatase activity
MNTPEFNLNLAVVVGINEYRNGIPILWTARQDAEAIADILRTDYQYQVHLFTDKTHTQATSQNLSAWLETELPELLKAANPSRLLFYFAGHGIALNGDDGPQGYLILQDAKLGDSKTYLPMQLVEEALSKLSCRHCLVILDCCFAGAFRWSSTRKLVSITETIHKERYDRFIQDPAWQVITSAASDQYANDSLDIKGDRGIAKNNTNHSPFAAALIEALSGAADTYPPANNGKPAGDGVITATELYLHLRDSVEIPTDAKHQRQTPQIWCLKKHDKGEYIFLSPGHPLNLPPAPPLDGSSNPYRGLESFDEAHKDLFFGRQALTQQLAEFVTAHSLTVVLGASGSGKSSLVKAGLIPHLRQTKDWTFLPPFRPGESPLKALNLALASVSASRVDLGTLPEDSGLLPSSESQDHWFVQHPQSRLLVVIDQLEELITLCRDEQERQQFLEELAKAIANHPKQLHLVLTLRSDFEAQFRNTTLESQWQAARFIVPAMTREELRQAVEEPASARVIYFEPHDLVDRLMDEVANMPGALPLLSFALSELYLNYLKRQEAAKLRGKTIDRAMTQADFEELGGVTRSLTQRAEQEYTSLVQTDLAYEQTIRNVMLRMVALGGELARRRVPLSELEYPGPENARVQEAIGRFSTARLLVNGTDADDKPYIEPAHDALVRGWDKLLAWKNEEEGNLLLQRRVTPAALEWERVKKTDKEQSKGIVDKTEPILDWLDRKLFMIENLLSKIPSWFDRLLRRSRKLQDRSESKPAHFLWYSNPYLDLLNRELQSKGNGFNLVEREFIQESALQKRQNVSWRWRGVITITLITSYLALNQIVQELYLKPKAMGRLKVISLEGKDLSSQTTLVQIKNTGEKQENFLWRIPFFYLDSIPKGLYYIEILYKDYIIKHPIKIEGYKNYIEPVEIRIPLNRISAATIKDMAFVPGGQFSIVDINTGTSSQQSQSVMIDPFFIDKYEVNNQKYKKFLKEIESDPLNHRIFYNGQPQYKLDRSGYQPVNWGKSSYQQYSSTDNNPVINIDWYDAFAYCAWQGKRLPTVLEWEMAASGRDLSGNAERSKYPWGNELDISKANTSEKPLNNSLDRETEEVDKYPNGVSFYGVFNLIGNAFEWVDIWYVEPLLDKNRTISLSNYRQQSLKGGSFGRPTSFIYYSSIIDANRRESQFGFRCAISKSNNSQ